MAMASGGEMNWLNDGYDDDDGDGNGDSDRVNGKWKMKSELTVAMRKC